MRRRRRAASAGSTMYSSATPVRRRTLRCGFAATSVFAATKRSSTSAISGAKSVPLRLQPSQLTQLHLCCHASPNRDVRYFLLPAAIFHAQCTHFRYGDDAPAEMESALRCASAVLVIVTTNFLRSKFCLEELRWACDELQQWRQHAPQGQQRVAAPKIIPLFYHDQDPDTGFGVDNFERSKLQKLLRQHHAAVSKAARTQWLDALMALAEHTGIRQDSVKRCVEATVRPGNAYGANAQISSRYIKLMV